MIKKEYFSIFFFIFYNLYKDTLSFNLKDMKKYIVRRTESWAYSIDLYKNWEFIKTISQNNQFELSNEVELNSFLENNFDLKEDEALEILHKKYNEKYWLKDEFNNWLEIDLNEDDINYWEQEARKCYEYLKDNFDKIEDFYFLTDDKKEVLKDVINFKEWFNLSNTKEYFSKIIEEVNKIWMKEFYCIWWWTSLAVLWMVDRNSEDIDIFCYQEDILSIKEKVENRLWIKLRYNDFNWWYMAYINKWEENEYKIEIVPLDYEIEIINVNWYIFMDPKQTLRNKFNAILTREERRDIYDLAILSFKLNKEFEELITEKHANRILDSEKTIKTNKKLLKVLKDTERDFRILDDFFKYLREKYNKKSNIYF